MALNKYKLGDLIQESFRKNTDLVYDISYVRGISNNKQITETKADVGDSVIHKFYIVNPSEFIYNPRTTRMGDKVGLGFNNTDSPLLFSFNNVAFYIKEEAKRIIIPEYLYLYFNRSEFDRYCMTNSWGSATELFTIDEMYDIDIELPDLATQQKYVDIYLAMVANQQSYERGLDDLKLVCDGYIEDLRRKHPCEEIGEYITQSDSRNDMGLGIDNLRGISTSKEFIETKADMDGVSLDNYKTVKPKNIAFVSDTSRRGEKISLAFNDSSITYLVSSITTVFTCDEKELLAEYLILFLTREEFNRYARFNSWGSARETFCWEDMCEVRIPIPDIEVQKSIADIYKVYIKRKEINEKLKSRIKSLCPILIKGSLEEGR